MTARGARSKAAQALLLAMLWPGLALGGQTLSLGAPDKRKYAAFDPETHAVFVAHGSEVTVADAGGTRIIGHVGGLAGVHGVALVPGGHGYASGRSGTVTVFDTKSFRILRTLPAQADANAVVYDKASRHIFVMNDDADSMTIIDPASDKVVQTIKLPGDEGLEAAVSDENGHIFINHSAEQDVLRIDTVHMALDAAWKLTDCPKPQGIAIDAVRYRLFVSCEAGQLLILDSRSGQRITSVLIGRGNEALQFDALRHRLYAPTPDGVVSVIDTGGSEKYAVLPSLKVAAGARTGALDEGTGRLYVVAGGPREAPTLVTIEAMPF